ncbi:GGDEF domain-containing protein [Undibacterium sp. FT147W]|uniref:diguanylate cyclase n=1 Tax=Undibacterium rivi TaxID=2828729 RepID=A0ABS5H3R0_9BURK|nr:GGDEF domain-containing protein [Undibacterium rivi]MBR7793338.1 GGDEF domain-containing protein [Undibacterium rivi]
MKPLDIYTLVFMNAFICIGMSVIMFSVHRTFKSEVQGVGHWAWAQLMTLLALPILATQAVLSEYIAIPGFNGAMLWGQGMTLIGTQLFYGQKPTWRLFLFIWGLTIAALMWWLAVTPNFSIRVAIYSLTSFGMYCALVRLVWLHGEKQFSSYFFVALLLLHAALTLIRGGFALAYDGASVNLLKTSNLATTYLATSTILVQLLSVVFLVMASRRLKAVLEQRAVKDPLTGVLNRRGCGAYYERLQLHARQADFPLALLAIDLDHFKCVNDQHGHAVGDQVLVFVAGKICQLLRECDQIARFGGEEFVVLLPGTTVAEARVVAARIQATLKNAQTDLPLCTLSIGIAGNSNVKDDFDHLLQRADAALYRAKNSGRDIIETDHAMLPGSAISVAQ